MFADLKSIHELKKIFVRNKKNVPKFQILFPNFEKCLLAQYNCLESIKKS